MRITDQSRPVRAIVRGVPVLLALFAAVTADGRRVRGLAAQYPDGSRAVGMVPAELFSRNPE